MAFARDRWILIFLACSCAAPLRAQQTTIPADSIVPTAPVGTLSELLTGRVPGLLVLPNDGSAGAGAKVVIRGESPPLLVIDGVRADNDPGRDNPATPDHPVPGRFDDIDPAEIAHIEVLPGAAAAALYGPDAGNGVILVTTKHAASKARGFITAEGARVNTPVDQPDNYYAWGHQGGTPVQCVSYLRATSQCTLDSVTHFNPLPATLATVYQERVGAAVEGTTPTQRLFLGGHWANDPGTWQMPASDADIYANEHGFSPPRSHTLPNRQQTGDIRGSFGVDLAKTVDADLTLGYVSRYQRAPSSDAILSSASAGPGYLDANNGWSDSLTRPWNTMADVARENARHVNGGLTINWRPSAVWVTHLTLGVDALDQTAGDMFVEPAGVFSGGTLTTYDHTRLTQYTVDAGATLTEGDSVARSQTMFGLQYLAEHFHDSTLAVASNRLIQGSSQSRSAYAREALTLADKLVLGAGARFDNQRLRALDLASWTLNPSLDASLTLVGSAADPRLRFRGSLGQTSTLPDVREGTQIANIVFTQFGCPPSSPCFGAPTIRPERQREVEAGIDASLPKDRFTFGLTFYARRNVHELVPTLAESGILSIPFPLLMPDALVTDRGVEFTIGAKLADSPTFGWDVTLDASENTNKVLRLDETAATRFGPVHADVGHPISGLWSTAYSYSDANHDGVIELNEITANGFPNAQFVGSTVPTHLVSASSSMQVFKRKLRIATLFDYRGGYALPDVDAGTFFGALNARALNESGASLRDQAAALAARQGVVVAQRVSALRWRELSATVGAPALHSMQLTVAVRNLRLWTGYHGADPDWNVGPPSTTGLIPFQLPEPTTWLLRVTAGF